MIQKDFRLFIFALQIIKCIGTSCQICPAQAAQVNKIWRKLLISNMDDLLSNKMSISIEHFYWADNEEICLEQMIRDLELFSAKKCLSISRFLRYGDNETWKWDTLNFFRSNSGTFLTIWYGIFSTLMAYPFNIRKIPTDFSKNWAPGTPGPGYV